MSQQRQEDHRYMGAALAMARRGRGRTGSNPNVGCLLVRDHKIVGRGYTQDGGRPHAEAMALAEAGARAKGATAYVTLEPCAHQSARGPSCADSLIAAGIHSCVYAMQDPDPRTAGAGLARLQAAGISVRPCRESEGQQELAGFTSRIRGNGPELTLKLAMSLDGRVAMPDGRSQWITGPVARAYAHLLRAETDLIFVGGATLRNDKPQLTNRLPGSTAPDPVRAALTSGPVPDGFLGFADYPALLSHCKAAQYNRILCEGGGAVAASLLAADVVDQLVLIRAPILIGAGRGLEGLQPADLAQTHGRWTLMQRRQLGDDLLEIYRRVRA